MSDAVKFNRPVRYFFIVAFVIVVALLGFGVSYTFFRVETRLEPVHRIESFSLLTPVVRRGGPLVVSFVYTRTLECAVQVNRFIINKRTGVVVWTAIVPGIEKVGAHVAVTRSFLFPVELPPDEYKYQSITQSSNCRGDDRPVPPTYSPLMDFRVMD